jgi:hypothetical protein
LFTAEMVANSAPPLSTATIAARRANGRGCAEQRPMYDAK